MEDVALQRVDADVEPRGDPEAAGGGPEGDRGLALPRAAGGGDLQRALADSAAHGHAVERDLLVRAEVVDDGAVGHGEGVDQDRLLHRGGRPRFLARRDLEARGVEPDGLEREGLAEQESGSEEELPARNPKPIGRPLDHEVLDVGPETPGDDVEPLDAAARTEPALQPPLDVPAQQVLREEPDDDQAHGDQREQEDEEDDAAAS